MKKLFALAAALVLPLVAMIGIGAASASPPDALQAAKAASAKYHSIEQALADGYVRNSPCEAIPGLGGMGYHYGNQALVRDPTLDPERPEVLLYAPKANGKLQLVGVEYLKVDADQNLATDSDRPSLFGQSFQGPMLGHGPPGAMPIHYDLHVWLWQDNPNGMFAQWNPDVTCPAH